MARDQKLFEYLIKQYNAIQFRDHTIKTYLRRAGESEAIRQRKHLIDKRGTQQPNNNDERIIPH